MNIDINKLKYEINNYCNINDSSDVSHVLYDMAQSLLSIAIKENSVSLFICKYPFLIGILKDIQSERSKIIKMNSQVVWYMDSETITLDDINAILDSDDQECMCTIQPDRFGKVLDKNTAKRILNYGFNDCDSMLSKCKGKEWYNSIV